MALKLPIIISVLALTSTAGCKRDKASEADRQPDESSDRRTGKTATDVPVEPDQTTASNPAMVNRMKHCPAAVNTAATSVEKTDGSVLVIITARDASGIAEIRERVAHLAKVVGADSPDIRHSGEGTGGATGKCPAIQKGVEIAAEEIDNGVVVMLTPDDSARLDEVYRTAAARARSLNRRGGKAHGTGTGGGHGAGAGARHGGGREGADKENPCGG